MPNNCCQSIWSPSSFAFNGETLHSACDAPHAGAVCLTDFFIPPDLDHFDDQSAYILVESITDEIEIDNKSQKSQKSCTGGGFSSIGARLGLRSLRVSGKIVAGGDCGLIKAKKAITNLFQIPQNNDICGMTHFPIALSPKTCEGESQKVFVALAQVKNSRPRFEPIKKATNNQKKCESEEYEAFSCGFSVELFLKTPYLTQNTPEPTGTVAEGAAGGTCLRGFDPDNEPTNTNGACATVLDLIHNEKPNCERSCSVFVPNALTVDGCFAETCLQACYTVRWSGESPIYQTNPDLIPPNGAPHPQNILNQDEIACGLTLYNATTGQRVVFSSDLVLRQPDVLVLNSLNGQITLNGAPVNPNWYSGQIPCVHAGANQILLADKTHPAAYGSLLVADISVYALA